ncbi:hypothetical protein LY78DRAFT_671658 [Colletotrichum sublineola]|nr:hypothetical protein LY78DRAFT_671658 [Colletotrichum sublineola]
MIADVRMSLLTPYLCSLRRDEPHRILVDEAFPRASQLARAVEEGDKIEMGMTGEADRRANAAHSLRGEVPGLSCPVPGRNRSKLEGGEALEHSGRAQMTASATVHLRLSLGFHPRVYCSV